MACFTPSTPRRRASCGSARRGRARSRSRTGWGSRSPHTCVLRSTFWRSGLISSAQTSSERGLRPARLRSRYCSVRPESTMSSTISTSRPSITASRSLRIRTTPEDLVAEPYEATAMKSTSHGTSSCAHQVGQEQHGTLQNADQHQILPRVVARDLRGQLADPALQILGRDEDLPDRVVAFHGADLDVGRRSLLIAIAGRSGRAAAEPDRVSRRRASP